jgi:hypothetical protein
MSRNAAYADTPDAHHAARAGDHVHEVLEFALERCEGVRLRLRAAGPPRTAPKRPPCAVEPDGICSSCGTVRCRRHSRTSTAENTRRCTDCGGNVIELGSASVELVLDALRRRPASA